MRKRSKKFLSLCLALVICLGLVPTAALAADITVTEIIPCKYDYIDILPGGVVVVRQDTGKKNQSGRDIYQYGIIDVTGQKVGPCKYDNVYSFSEGFARVVTGKRWGMVDKTGREVISCQYTNIGILSEGLAVIENENGKCGYIDNTGTIVIPCRYDKAYTFSEGLALVVDENGQLGYIDKTGKLVITCAYKRAGNFSGGLTPVSDQADKFGFMDKTGKLVVPCTLEYTTVGPFSEGIARVVRVIDRNNSIEGIIDITGKEIIVPGTYTNIWELSEGVARVSKGTRLGLVGKTGVIVPLMYSGMGDFSEGLAVVSDDGRGYGYIDKTGKEVIPCKYSYAENFSEGLAKVAVGREYNSRYGYIDKTGKLVISCEYWGASEFSEGVAAVCGQNEKYGYIDKNGKAVIPFQYDSAEVFSEGLARVALSNGKDERGNLICQWGLIDKSGKEVMPCKYDEVSSFSDGLAKVRLNGKWGVLALTATGKAKESKQTISIDGKDVSFAMYSPDNGGTNYVRLVDLAVALKGTAGQFNVGYDGKVLLTTGVAYTGAASTAPFHSAMEYTMLDEPTYVNGVAKNLEGIRFEYQNGGYTYYKLRDLGQALGFNVGWDNATQRIYIESDKPYDPNN